MADKSNPRTSPAAFAKFPFSELRPYQIRMMEWLMNREPDEVVTPKRDAGKTIK